MSRLTMVSPVVPNIVQLACCRPVDFVQFSLVPFQGVS